MDDWRLKVLRAEKHMIDIGEEARKYASSHPYDFIRVRWPDSKNEIRYRFHITKQPDPMIAIMLGDFIHNLRSALDYIVVACVPKQRRAHAGFPILFEDIFKKDEGGQFVVKDAELRKNFDTATEGLHLDARTFIVRLQPYNHGNNVHLNTLGIISRLENADKHRQLIAVGCGGREFSASLVFPECPDYPFEWIKDIATDEKFFKDNTVINFPLPPNIPDMGDSPIKPSQMNMQFTGTAKILVKVSRIGGNHPPENMLLDILMDSAMADVRGVLEYLEPFVCKT